MYDRQVRRRRAVLFALVACCLVLLTAYFGESSGGPLSRSRPARWRSLAPVQEGANRALKPFRDLFGWFGDTLDAKSSATSSRPSATGCASRSRSCRSRRGRTTSCATSVDFARNNGLDAYSRYRARLQPLVLLLVPTMEINKGSSDGVAVNQPVINGKGLVGKVKTVSDGNASRDAAQRLGVRGVGARRPPGSRVDPAGRGSPGDLRSTSCREPRRCARAT